MSRRADLSRWFHGLLALSLMAGIAGCRSVPRRDTVAGAEKIQDLAPSAETMARANQRLLDAARDGDLFELRRAILDGADPAARTLRQGETALHLAARGNYDEIITWMLRNTDVNVDLVDARSQNTALHTAAMLGNQRAADALVDHGARITIRNQDGLTPVTIAERNRLNWMARHLSQRAARAEQEARSRR